MEMEGENIYDPFHSLIANCKPTASQEQKLSNCPFAGYDLSNPFHFSSSSSDSIPSHQTPILMLSVSDSDASLEQPLQDHNDDHPSSPENLNLNALLAAIEREDRDKREKVGISEGKLNSDPKRTRVLSEELDGGETVPVGETEVIVRISGEELEVEETIPVGETEEIVRVLGEELDVEETVPVGETEDILQGDEQDARTAEVVVVGSDGSVEEETNSVNLANDLRPRMINSWFGKLAGFVGFFKHLAEGQQESSKRYPKRTRDIDDEAFGYVVVGDGDGEQMWIPVSSSLIENVNEKEKSVEENNGGNEKMNEKEKSLEQKNSGNEKKKKKVVEQKNIGKKRKLPGSLFRDYDSLDCYSKYRKLPDSSTKAKEKLIEREDDSKSGMWEDLLNAVKPVLGDKDDLDILEMANKKGMTYLRPRWWPPEGDKW